MHGKTPRRLDGGFRGIMINTGVSHGRSREKRQYFAYCKATEQNSYIDIIRAARCHFRIGMAISAGVGNIRFTIGNL